MQENELIAVGNAYRICFNGDRFALPGMLGLDILAQLLERPGEDLRCDRLLGHAYGKPGIESLNEPRIDNRTRRNVIAAMESASAPGELAALQHYLDGSLHNKRTLRWRIGARVAVRRAILRAIGKIDQLSPHLARHIQSFVHTGQLCRYTPVAVVPWIIRTRFPVTHPVT